MWCCYDTWIHRQVVHTNASTVKWTHARFSTQNNPTRMEKHKKLSWWYCHTVVSFNWLQKQLQDTKWRRTYCQVMTAITSFWMSTVAPLFSSASTTCSWPSWHAHIIGVQPFCSGMTIGAHWDEEHELTPTVAYCFTEMCTSESSLLFSQSNCKQPQWLQWPWKQNFSYNGG